MSACMLISRSSEALRLLLSIVRAARPGPIDPLLVQRGRGTGFPRQPVSGARDGIPGPAGKGFSGNGSFSSGLILDIDEP